MFTSLSFVCRRLLELLMLMFAFWLSKIHRLSPVTTATLPTRHGGVRETVAMAPCHLLLLPPVTNNINGAWWRQKLPGLRFLSFAGADSHYHGMASDVQMYFLEFQEASTWTWTSFVPNDSLIIQSVSCCTIFSCNTMLGSESPKKKKFYRN